MTPILQALLAFVESLFRSRLAMQAEILHPGRKIHSLARGHAVEIDGLHHHHERGAA